MSPKKNPTQKTDNLTVNPNAKSPTRTDNLTEESKPYQPKAPDLFRTNPSSEHKKGPTTRITIKYDVGFSNSLYLRGKGPNLSWDKGIMLKNISADEWVWETNTPFTTCEFKVLLNDRVYEIGDNHLLSCGAAIQYTPKFQS